MIPADDNEGFTGAPSPFYDEESWRAYLAAVQKNRRVRSSSGHHDAGAYLPSPDEIARRCGDLLWLEVQGFSSEFIRSVMWHACPSIHKVVYAVEVKAMSVERVEELLHECGEMAGNKNGNGKAPAEKKRGRRRL